MAWIILFTAFIVLIGFDMLVLHKKNEKVSHKKAAIETAFWVAFAMLFSIAVYYFYKFDWIVSEMEPAEAVTKYLTGYLIELSLSVDNLFVIATIFASQKVPMKYQHRVLFWGIVGAIVMRALMIFFGIALMEKFEWMTYVFGAFLLYTAFNMLKHENDEHHEDEKFKFVKKYFKVTKNFHAEHFWIIENGKRVFTPLFIALIMIEFTDVIFALDSIPAILAVTTERFIVFSSNIFAILGLRSMYFFLANMLEKFHYLKYSIFAILVFVSIKLLLLHTEFIKLLPSWFSLTFIGVSLLLGVLVSVNKITHDDVDDLKD